MHSTRPVSPGSKVPLRALVAAAIALGLVLTFAVAASAAPVVTIDSGPRGPTNDTMPVFGFTVDSSATAIYCSIDQGLELYVPCSDTFSPVAPLAEGDYTFRVRADDGVDATIVTQDFTVDVTRPSLSIDSGPSGPTNDATPSFGFTAEAGASVECSVDQGSPAYAPCTSPYVSSALLDGSYAFRVRATDAAGNQATDTQSFSVDSAAPSLSIDSGPSGPTNDRTPTFGFTAEGGASIQCSVDQGSPSYGPCTRTTSHTAAALADGSYTFRVKATDAAGNAAVATQSFSVDTAPPSLSINAGPSGLTNDPTPSFGFAAGGDATTVECSIDQGAPVFASCAGSFEPPAPLGDGSYTFRVRAIDAAGNAVTLTRSFSVDATPPSLSIDSGPSGPTNDRTPSFGFTVTGATTLECSVDQGTPAYRGCTTGSSHTSATLADGSYTFRVRARDLAGNETFVTRSFSVDATPPTLSIDSGPSGPTNDTTPSFGFTAGADATTVECSIDHGTPAFAPCSAPYAPSAPLTDGSYTFRVRVRDALGNPLTRTQDFSIDREAPSLSIDSGPSGPTNDTTPSFGFTAEAGARVECSVDQGTVVYRSCTTTTSHTAALLAQGSYVFHVRATDAVGNTAETFRGFTVDTTPPSLSIDAGPSGTTSDSTPLFQFTTEAGATVECSIDQGAPAYAPCTSARAHAAVAPLADGTYTFSVRATDRAGNQTVASRTFTVDTVPETPGPGSPRTDPTPPVTTPVTPRPAPARPQLLSPFPLVRISGTLTSTGARIRLLTVRASPGTLVRVTVSPACSGRRPSSRRCRVVQAAGTVGRRAVIGFRVLEHAYRSGTVIVVRVWRADRIGKYTRFTIVRGKAPRRVDQCLAPEATSGSRCPAG